MQDLQCQTSDTAGYNNTTSESSKEQTLCFAQFVFGGKRTSFESASQPSIKSKFARPRSCRSTEEIK